MSNVFSNRVSATLSATAITNIKNHIAGIKAEMPFLVGATVEERQTMPKISEANRVFTSDAVEHNWLTFLLSQLSSEVSQPGSELSQPSKKPSRLSFLLSRASKRVSQPGSELGARSSELLRPSSELSQLG